MDFSSVYDNSLAHQLIPISILLKFMTSNKAIEKYTVFFS